MKFEEVETYERLIYFFSSAANATSATLFIASMGLLIMTVEDVSTRKLYLRENLFSWDVLSSRPLFAKSSLNIFFDLIFNGRVWFAIQIAVCVALLCSLVGFQLCVALTIVSVYLVLFVSRNVYGFDGSDQVFQIVFFSLTASYILQTPNTNIFFVCFIALQAVFAYFFSGLNKLKGKLWREGTAFNLIISTKSFGNKSLHAFLLTKPLFSKSLNWFTVIFQLLFPLALMLNIKMFLLYLVIGVAFHLGIAYFMGLNTFLWAFCSTYPCIVFLKLHLKSYTLEKIITTFF